MPVEGEHDLGYLSSEDTSGLLGEPIISFITTLRADGTPHTTPVWHIVDGDDVVVAVGRDTVKARNVGRNPSVSLCVVEGSLTRTASDPPQRWVMLNGTARISEDRVEELVRAVSYHYLGEEDGAPYVEDILGKLDFVLLRITPTRVTGFDGLE